MNTVKTEEYRGGRSKLFQKQRISSASVLRGQNGGNKPGRMSSQCTQDCVQLACVGDCPDKMHSSLTCSKCNKKCCNGTCNSTPYSNHSRLSNDLDSKANIKVKANRSQRPKSCSSCSMTNNPAREINARHVSLGRPKSSHFTYSRAKKSSKRAAELKKTLVELSVNSDQLDDNQTSLHVPRARSARVRRGRDTVAPHKSYHSQRRISLTTATIRPVFGVNPSSGRQRAKSARSYY